MLDSNSPCDIFYIAFVESLESCLPKSRMDTISAFTLGGQEIGKLKTLGLTDIDIDRVSIVCEKKGLSKVTKEMLQSIVIKVVHTLSMTGSRPAANSKIVKSPDKVDTAETAPLAHETKAHETKESGAEGVNPDKKEGSSTAVKPTPTAEKVTDTEVCKHHLAGICRHPDDKCKYAHPVICSTFKKYAWKEKGCQKKKECEHLHPRVCRKVIKGRECKTKCMLLHPTDIPIRKRDGQVSQAKAKTNQGSQKLSKQQHQQVNRKHQRKIEEEGQGRPQPQQHRGLSQSQADGPGPQQRLGGPLQQPGGPQQHQGQPQTSGNQPTSEVSFLEMRLEQMQAAILSRVQEIVLQQFQVQAFQRPAVLPPPGFPRPMLGYPGC